MASSIYLEAFLAGLLVTLFLTFYIRPKRNTIPCPPSLKADFIIGHARSIPLEKEWEVFSQWGKQLNSTLFAIIDLFMHAYWYVGDIVHAEVLGQHIVVLNSLEATVDLLDKRSSNYSDRPDLTMLNDAELYAPPLLSFGSLLNCSLQDGMGREHRNTTIRRWLASSS